MSARKSHSHHLHEESSRHRDRDRTSKESSRSKKKEDGHARQKGIDSVKNRLKSSLSSAINESSIRDSQNGRQIKFDGFDTSDSIERQNAINRIEEPGFQPASFKSNVDSSRMKHSADKKANKNAEASTHDRAMFGPLWAKNVIEKKQRQQKGEDGGEGTQPQQKEEASRFPLAHANLSQDPEIRMQRWKELFKERRKLALEGLL